MSHLIATSILSADFANLQDACEMLNKSEADWYHVDVMDGRFVPNISFGMPVIKAIKPHAEKPFDVHLMIVEPDKYITDFKNAGADILTGGAGNNTFLYVNPGDGVDTITDFISGVDKIMIVGAVFSPGLNGGSPSADEFFVGSGATDANHRFGYDNTTGEVFFDRDGVGGAAADVLATLTGVPAFDRTDIVVL